MDFNFDSLDSTQFEEFCYDLLSEFEPIELQWRKGTALGSSPSDQGRDLQATFMKTEFDGSKIFEKWFIECKHYQKGLPPEKLQGALSWAVAERPDRLLIIVSGFLSNACSNYLKTYQETNRPPFRIVIWDRKKLESMTSGNAKLRAKYKLTNELPFMSYINKYHAEYSLKSRYNSIKFFVSALDELDAAFRDEVFMMAYLDLIKPRFRRPRNPQESLRDCMVDTVNYEVYRETLLCSPPDELSYVHQTVSTALSYYFTLSDITNIDNVESNLSDLYDTLTFTSCTRSKAAEFILDLKNNHAENTKQRYEKYNFLCNTFVKTLLSETPSLEDEPITLYSVWPEFPEHN